MNLIVTTYYTDGTTTETIESAPRFKRPANALCKIGSMKRRKNPAVAMCKAKGVGTWIGHADKTQMAAVAKFERGES